MSVLLDLNDGAMNCGGKKKFASNTTAATRTQTMTQTIPFFQCGLVSAANIIRLIAMGMFARNENI